jgi:predicted Zn-ribbon and HTH transcriptional regulator
MDARELADRLGLEETEVAGHLEHVRRSAAAARETLLAAPARCLLCGYEFEERRRLNRPGRCPKCRRSKIAGPAFRLVPAAPGRRGGPF